MSRFSHLIKESAPKIISSLLEIIKEIDSIDHVERDTKMHLLVVILNKFVKSHHQEAKQSTVEIVGCGSIWLLRSI